MNCCLRRRPFDILVRRFVGETEFPTECGDALRADVDRIPGCVGNDRLFDSGTLEKPREEDPAACLCRKEVCNQLEGRAIDTLPYCTARCREGVGQMRDEGAPVKLLV